VYSQRIEGAVDEFNTIYGLAEAAYKRLQTLLEQIDDKIHNEFRYCSRGLKEFVVGLPTATEDESIERLQKATHAVKNAFNDAIDLILGYASVKIGEFSHIDTGKELVLYIPTLQVLLLDIAKISKEISESRGNIERRVGIYSDILSSVEFGRVVEFCQIIPIVGSNIRADYGRVVRDSRRFFVTMSVTTIGVLVGALGVIVKLPDFIKYLAKFFPWFLQFL
jgi:hypothetical protein